MTELTREKILAMEPGRELDLLVENLIMNRFKSHMRHGEWVYPAPRSRNIAAAWEVEDKVYSISAEMSLIYTRCLIDVMKLGQGRHLSTLAKLIRATAEQRCKAALLAVMGI